MWTAATIGFIVSPAGRAQGEQDHAAAVEEWRQGRVERLTSEDGWLTLVGLFWLQEGENRLGGGERNEIPFPGDKAPVRIGTIERSGGRLVFEAEPTVEVLHAGQRVSSLELADDSEGAPTILELGDFLFHVIRRGDRQGVRIKDRRSPARDAFDGIESFPVALEWRIDARFEPYEEGYTIPVPTVLGTVIDQPCWGAVVFEADGRTARLDVAAAPGAERLFIIFADATTGTETYGGGRYLYAAAPDADGRVVVDFNKAYNPPCVFTPYATCPLPPKQNKLAVRVEAGERMYATH